jgi:hypothetical protein
MMLRPITILTCMLSACIAVVLTWLVTQAEKPQRRAVELAIYRKTLNGIGDLVVTRGPDRPVSEVFRIYPKRVSAEDYTNCFDIRVDIHLERAAPITLAILLGRDTKSQGGYEVLDALFANGTFVIVAAENGSITVTRILPTQRVPIVAFELPQTDWTRAAALVRIERAMVNCKLGWTKDGRVEVTVDDLRPNLRQHTTFVQKPNAWDFEKVAGERAKPSK